MRIQSTTSHAFRWRLWLPALLVVLSLVACGSDDGDGGGGTDPTADTAASLTSDGWALFITGNFSNALSKFDAAIGLDAGYAEAYVGQGWTRLNLASSASEMINAVGSFNTAISLGSSGAEVLAGRAAAHLGRGTAGFASAIADAQAARTADAGFQFSHRPSIDTDDMHLVEAFAQLGQTDFDAALDAANQVVASGIDAGNASTWTVGGVDYTSYQGAVLAFLQQMSDEHAG